MQMIIDAKQRFSVFFSCFFVEKSFFWANLAKKMKKIISLRRKRIIIFVSSSFLPDPKLGKPFSRPFCFAWSNMADHSGRRSDEVETFQITIEKDAYPSNDYCRKKGSSALYVKNGNGISGTPVQSSPNPA